MKNKKQKMSNSFWEIFKKDGFWALNDPSVHPSIQAALRAGDPGGERMVGSTQSLDAHGLSELFWKIAIFSPKKNCAKFFEKFSFFCFVDLFIKDVLKYVLGGHETIR